MKEYADTMIPFGSIVEIKDGNKLLIIGYGLEDKKANKVYDYFGCDSVYGLVSGFKPFDFEDVKKVIFKGYTNEPLINIYNKKAKEGLK